MSDVTLLLDAAAAGDRKAAADLLPLVYDELRNLAAARLAGESPPQTLQATAPVYEAYPPPQAEPATRGSSPTAPPPGERAGHRRSGGRHRPARPGRGPRPPRSRLS